MKRKRLDQGRTLMFYSKDELRQWIKERRREDFPLKTSHYAPYQREKYRAWMSPIWPSGPL